MAESDFRLRPGSPALALGFTQIDMLPMGLNADFRFGKPNEPLGRVFVRSGDQFASLHLRRAGLAILRVDGRTVSGYRADLRGAQIRYASSNSLVALVTPLGGIVTGLFGGAAEITVTVTKGAVTKTTSIVVIVG